MNSQWQLVYDNTTDTLIEKNIQFFPGFLKIFNEVTIDPEKNLISVYNNGSRILVEIHKEEKVYIPELIFGHLLTSSNYDNCEKKVVGEHKRYGAKLYNIFSSEFIVEMASKKLGKKYYQKFSNNISVIGPPKITKLVKGEEFTKITY
ncbi:DNA topoisomerase 2 [Massospora cicadina]|nr:DNA topoisomerase 2 [Massospora cicadina]